MADPLIISGIGMRPFQVRVTEEEKGSMTRFVMTGPKPEQVQRVVTREEKKAEHRAEKARDLEAHLAKLAETIANAERQRDQVQAPLLEEYQGVMQEHLSEAALAHGAAEYSRISRERADELEAEVLALRGEAAVGDRDLAEHSDKAQKLKNRALDLEQQMARLSERCRRREVGPAEQRIASLKAKLDELRARGA